MGRLLTAWLPSATTAAKEEEEQVPMALFEPVQGTGSHTTTVVMMMTITKKKRGENEVLR